MGVAMILFVLVVLLVVLAAIALIVMGVLNLTNSAKQQTNVIEETGVFVQKRKSGLSSTAKAGWIKIGIGAAIIWVGVIITVILLIF